MKRTASRLKPFKSLNIHAYCSGEKRGSIRGTAMRLLRTNSSVNTTFEECLTNFKLRLETRGCPKTIDHRNVSIRVNFTSKPSTLKQKKKMPPCSAKSPTNSDSKLESNTKLAVAENELQNLPIISYKRGLNL